MTYSYKTKGTCSTKISFDLDGDQVRNVRYTSGCSGNLQGIGSLVEGMTIDEVISRLSGIKCGVKPTSCPDQLAQALKDVKDKR